MRYYLIRHTVYEILTDRKKGIMYLPIKFFLWLCEYLYRGYIYIILFGYRKNLFYIHRPAIKVIGIGNLTLGGTGKTQACMMLARFLVSLDRRPAILIRGYGRDESFMLREELDGVQILVGRNRVKNSIKAQEELNCDTLLLDDGFQHYRLRRDLDIVLIDATNPFGNGHLLPRGILREPIPALKRADFVIITKVDAISKDTLRQQYLYEKIRSFVDEERILEAIYQPSSLTGIDKEDIYNDLDLIREKRVAIFTGIANPLYLKYIVERCGAKVACEFVFPDHYRFSKDDLNYAIKRCQELKIEFFIITKKDLVRLKRLDIYKDSGDVTILVLNVEFEIVKNKEILFDRLRRL